MWPRGLWTGHAGCSRLSSRASGSWALTVGSQRPSLAAQHLELVLHPDLHGRDRGRRGVAFVTAVGGLHHFFNKLPCAVLRDHVYGTSSAPDSLSSFSILLPWVGVSGGEQSAGAAADSGEGRGGGLGVPGEVAGTRQHFYPMCAYCAPQIPSGRLGPGGGGGWGREGPAGLLYFICGLGTFGANACLKLHSGLGLAKPPLLLFHFYLALWRSRILVDWQSVFWIAGISKV